MKVSLNWGQYHSNVDLSALPHDELLRRIGTQLGAIEGAINYRDRYEGIVTVKVVSAKKHPNADKLTVCLVDDNGVSDNVDRNENGYVQVVCGAPNVSEGMFAVWIPPNVTVPSTIDKDPFVLATKEIRGELSNGMLASPKELDISEAHAGILELTKNEIGHDPQPGEPVFDYFGLDDFVVTCENKMFTRRPDCFGNLGVTREIAGIFDQQFSSPEWYTEPLKLTTTAENRQVSVKNELPELVSRFMLQVVEGVSVGESPIWMQAGLKRVGIRSVNNIVDLTNYYMHLTGQPTHAFDLDKLAKVCGVGKSDSLSIGPRLARAGETLTLLGDKTIELHPDDIVIVCNDTPVALAGVMGGAATEVDDTSKDIVIECATFDMYAIRRTSMRHGLFTDAVTRFTKGQSPLQNDRVLAKLTKDIVEFTGGSVGITVDFSNFDLANDNLNHVNTTKQFINERLGSELSAEQMKQLLENVEFKVEINDDNELNVTVPFWRMDIAIAEDLVEEIGRLYGYENLPATLPPRNRRPTAVNELRQTKQQIRHNLASFGANEVLTYSFVHGELLRKCHIDADTWAYHLRNALSPELQFYRPSLLPSLLAKVHPNIKAQAGSSENSFALFEIGKAHVKNYFEEDEPTLPKQMQRLAFVLAADAKTALNYGGLSPYFLAKRYIDALTNGQARYSPLTSNDYPITAPYEQKRSAEIILGNQTIGVVGELRASVRQSLKLPEFCAGFELDIEMYNQEQRPKQYKPLSNYPSVHADVTLEVSQDTTWAHVEQLLDAEFAVLSAENGYEYDLLPIDIYKPEESDKIRYSFRVTLSHYAKTMKMNEVESALQVIAEKATQQMAAIRI